MAPRSLNAAEHMNYWYLSITAKKHVVRSLTQGQLDLMVFVAINCTTVGS